MKNSVLWGVVFLSACSAVACGGAPGNEGDSVAADDIGQATFALVSVPTGVTCVQVSVFSDLTGTPLTSALVTQNFASTPGAAWSGTVPLGAFTRGQVQVTASAFSVACSSISTATATWVADPVVLTITPGKMGTTPLNFRQNFGVVASGNFASSVVDVVSSEFSTGLRLADGTVRMVGYMPQPTGLTNVAELALGERHACVRKTDGTMWCWGANNAGQLGNGTTTDSPTTPVQVPGLAGVMTIAVGWDTTCASTGTPSTGGGTFCWGSNANGQVGDGTTTNRPSPTAVGGFVDNSAKISTGFDHSCAVDTGGDLRCWGQNGNGQLGNNTTTNSFTPVFISSSVLHAATSVTVGQLHTCALDPSNKAYCWGSNGSGQLGTGNNTQAMVPTLIGGTISSQIAEIKAMSSGTCARTTSGAVYCWGSGTFGSNGDGSGGVLLSPVQVLTGATEVTAGGSEGNAACALLSDESVWCWGNNGNGQVGDGTAIDRYKPTPLNL